MFSNLNKKAILLGSTLAFLSIIITSNCLDMEHAKGEKCFKIRDTAPVDQTWLSSLPEQYYPLMSLQDIYVVAQEILREDFANTTQPQLFYDSCIQLGAGTENGRFSFAGFDDRRSYMEWSTVRPGVTDFHLLYSGNSGRCYNTLTDNSTFYFLACCYADDSMTWATMSTEKVLPKETVTLIHDHARSLGFQEKYFAELRYGYCKDE